MEPGMNIDGIGKALGRVTSGLYILTSHYQDRDDAVLVSWVNQCSFDPPTISVVLSKTRTARLLVEASSAFVLNVIGNEDPKGLLKRFSKPAPPGSSIFDGVETKLGYQGITILNAAVSFLECELISQTPVEDHIIYIGKIVGGDILQGGEPYVHVRTSGFNY